VGGIHDVITHARFGDDHLRGSWVVWWLKFSISHWLCWSCLQLSHYRVSVIALLRNALLLGFGVIWLSTYLLALTCDGLYLWRINDCSKQHRSSQKIISAVLHVNASTLCLRKKRILSSPITYSHIITIFWPTVCVDFQLLNRRIISQSVLFLLALFCCVWNGNWWAYVIALCRDAKIIRLSRRRVALGYFWRRGAAVFRRRSWRLWFKKISWGDTPGPPTLWGMGWAPRKRGWYHGLGNYACM